MQHAQLSDWSVQYILAGLHGLHRARFWPYQFYVEFRVYSSSFLTRPLEARRAPGLPRASRMVEPRDTAPPPALLGLALRGLLMTTRTTLVPRCPARSSVGVAFTCTRVDVYAQQG